MSKKTEQKTKAEKKTKAKKTDPGSGKLAKLLAQNRSGARSVEKGKFRLDWKRALDKVKRYQLTDPHRYVLEIIQGAIAGGATAIDLTTDSDDVVITFDGARPDGQALEHLFDFLFAQDASLLPQKQLALGVNSALALEPKFVRVDTGNGKTAHRLQLSSHEDITVVELSGNDLVDGVRVHVRDRMSWHVLAEVFRSRSLEARLVTDHCRYAPVPITLDGKRMDLGVDLEAVLEHEFHGSVRGKLMLPATVGTKPRIHVCMNGVEVAPLAANELSWMDALGVVGYIDDPLLTRNASHTDLHRDERFRKLIAVLARNVRALLEKFVRIRLVESKGPTSDAEEYYLSQAVRALLRAPKGKNKKRLSKVEKALLDLPGVVELATEHPTHIALRPVWNGFRNKGVLGTASRRYGVRLENLPKDTYPVLGPPWLAKTIFRDTVESLDELLAATEIGQRNRQLREARQRPPELMPSEAFVQVAITGSHGIRGELGLTEGVEDSLKLLFDDAGELPEAADPRDATLAIFMRNNVPLGGRWVRTPLYKAVALLDSEAFEADRAWSDISPNKATRAASHLLAAAVPRLIETLATSFGLLPPPKNLREAGPFSAASAGRNQVMQEIGASWPTDTLARAARTQIDHVLARRKFPTSEAPSLHSWPLFFTVAGLPVSLEQIAGRVAVEGRGVIEPQQWKVAIQARWGEGEAKGETILNLTPLQKEVLERQLGRTYPNADSQLEASRRLLVRRAEVRVRRDANISRAEQRKHTAALVTSEYEVVLDIAVPGGTAQLAIPRLGIETSWLRPLIDGLPLAQQTLKGNFPIHAVVQSTNIKPDDAFDKPLMGPGYKKVLAAIQAARPRLLEAFAQAPGALTRNGVKIIWQHLHQLKVAKGQRGLLSKPANKVKGGKKPTASALSELLADFPLVPTVSGGRLSLREMTDEANEAQRKHFRYVEISPGQQETERPVVICSDQRRKTIARLTGLRGSDYSDDLKRESEAFSRMNRPRRRAELSEPTLLSVTISEDQNADFVGEVGIPAGIVAGHGKDSWVDVLIDGVPLERKSLDFSGLPVIAVISSKKLKANKAWKKVARNATWKRALRALREAADSLILLGCKLATERTREFRSPALLLAFQRTASERFRGRPAVPMQPSSEIETAVADAPIWESVDHRDFVSLREISEHWKRSGRVWLLEAGAGQLAPTRLMVRGNAATFAALREIFGGKVRDGRKVFERDQAAASRMAAAPPLQTVLVESSQPVDVLADKGPHALSVRGQVGTPFAYARSPSGILVSLGIGGRKLCNHLFEHRLRGVARLDCTDLHTNDDWNAPSDRSQLAWLLELAKEALWKSIALTVAAEQDGMQAQDSDDRRLLMVEALAEIMDGRGPDKLRAPLMATPIFRTVQRQLVSADELCTRKDAGETVYVVSDELDEGRPIDGRLLIRTSRAGLSGLATLLGDAMSRDDARWRRELEGAARFQTLLPSTAHLEGNIAASVFFHEGTTHGVIGLLVPPNRPNYGDDVDGPSAVGLHIGGRELCTLGDQYHPAIEVWVNDDRISPNGAFNDVDRNPVFAEVMNTVRARIPEILARGAEHWMSDATDGTRLRLCSYILEHREAIRRDAKEEPEDPWTRLLHAKLWDCLTGAGRARLSTKQLLESHAAGQLRVAQEDAPAESPEHGIVVALGGPEAHILTNALGEVADHTDNLEVLAARRAFHRRPRAAEISVASVARHEPLLGHLALDEPGIIGELGVPATPGRGIELHIFVDGRHFQTLELPAICRAIATVQSDKLSVTPRYDGIVSDGALDALGNSVRESLWDAIGQLVAALATFDPGRARFARIVLADALSTARASENTAPGFTRMRAALEAAPLFIDVNGQLWSLLALDEATPAGQDIRCVSAETAAVSAVPGELVLVMDDAMWVPMSRLLRLTRDDDRYLERARGAQRRNAASTTYKMPKNTIAVSELDSPLMTGELGLQVPVSTSSVAVFSRGRMVQNLSRPRLEGLCGYIDGAIDADRTFTSARLTDAHEQELQRLWRERLEVATAEAAVFKGRRSSAKWLALSGYAQRFLSLHIDALGSSMPRRRARVLVPGQELEPALRRALSVPMVQLNDGSWIDLATAISGDDPLIVVSEGPLKRAPNSEARVVLGDQLTLRLLSAVLGSGKVMTVQQARAAVKKAKARTEKKRVKSDAAKKKRAATADTRALSALKSLLREAGTQHFPLQLIKRIKLKELGRRADLVVVSNKNATDQNGNKKALGIVLNRDHGMWKNTVAAELDNAPDAGRHLAVTLVSILGHEDGALSGQAALSILSRLAR